MEFIKFEPLSLKHSNLEKAFNYISTLFDNNQIFDWYRNYLPVFLSKRGYSSNDREWIEALKNVELDAIPFFVFYLFSVYSVVDLNKNLKCLPVLELFNGCNYETYYDKVPNVGFGYKGVCIGRYLDDDTDNYFATYILENGNVIIVQEHETVFYNPDGTSMNGILRMLLPESQYCEYVFLDKVPELFFDLTDELKAKTEEKNKEVKNLLVKDFYNNFYNKVLELFKLNDNISNCVNKEDYNNYLNKLIESIKKIKLIQKVFASDELIIERLITIIQSLDIDITEEDFKTISSFDDLYDEALYRIELLKENNGSSFDNK